MITSPAESSRAISRFPAAEYGQRILVVSNRLPVTLTESDGALASKASSGGLVSALSPVLDNRNCRWLGWSGTDVTSHADYPRVVDEWDHDGLVPVELSESVASHFYRGFSNQTLWPIFHHFPTRLIYDADGWRGYVEANEEFCRRVVQEYREGDLIWVHDYHLMLLPKLLRAELPDAAIGFFLHIPFPSSEVFRVLPNRKDILAGLLGADLIGFHTYSHLQHFRTALLRVCGKESDMDSVLVGGRRVALRALPIGIDCEGFTGLLDSEETQADLAALRSQYADRHIILGVDRLDYTKGIPERLRAYRLFLESHPDLRGKVVMIQIAVPTRDGIDSYENLSQEVSQLVGEINGQCGTEDWTPLVYLNQAIPRSKLVALYAAADVCWVSPLRDGMNLVAKEYVACQPDGNGVLVLSEFAGAAEEMGEALQVNPYDLETTAETLNEAVHMSLGERRRRMGALRRRVMENDAHRWGTEFLTRLDSAAEARRLSYDTPAVPDANHICDLVRTTERRLFLLDYDGTLVPLKDDPAWCAPTPAVREVLVRLAEDPRNTVAVVSGRSRADIERWLGDLPGVVLAAEHGGCHRTDPNGEWESLRPDYSNSDLMERVVELFQSYTDRTPGSWIERKEHCSVWHFRKTPREFGKWLAQELGALLDSMLAGSDMKVVHGHDIVEVRPVWMNKGVVAENLARQTDADFVLCIGDDQTDEDMFAALPPEAITIRVGSERSVARYHLMGQQLVLPLLERLVPC